MSLVWNIGPLSGLVTQPVVGVIADRSRSRWGKDWSLVGAGAAPVFPGLRVLTRVAPGREETSGHGDRECCSCSGFDRLGVD